MNREIQKYLDELREALSGCDAATIQDALSDAEEHLTSAWAVEGETDSERSESDRLADIINEYGSVSEIAAAYRIIERRMKPSLAVPQGFYERSLASRFIRVVYDPRAWGALLYLTISMLTGIIYFTWVIAGLYLSIGLLILVIGLPIAFFFLLSFRGIALVEGRIIEGLLGIRMPRRPIFSDRSMGWWERLKILVRDKRTWLTVVYMILQLPLGIIYFTVVVVLFALAIDFVGIPIKQLFDLPLLDLGEYSVYVPDNLIPLVVLVGILLFVVLMHTARALGRLHGKLAKAMLVGS